MLGLARTSQHPPDEYYRQPDHTGAACCARLCSAKTRSAAGFRRIPGADQHPCSRRCVSNCSSSVFFWRINRPKSSIDATLSVRSCTTASRRAVTSWSFSSHSSVGVCFAGTEPVYIVLVSFDRFASGQWRTDGLFHHDHWETARKALQSQAGTRFYRRDGSGHPGKLWRWLRSRRSKRRVRLPGGRPWPSAR